MFGLYGLCNENVKKSFFSISSYQIALTPVSPGKHIVSNRFK